MFKYHIYLTEFRILVNIFLNHLLIQFVCMLLNWFVPFTEKPSLVASDLRFVLIIYVVGLILLFAGLYLHALTQTKLIVDTSRGEQLKINVKYLFDLLL